MALTRFPIETSEPRIQVTLPVGRHVLELVVEDSAGLRSAPDQVVIEVRKETVVPAIAGILPVSGIRGATVAAVISGTNLAGATAVNFSGSGVTATIGTGATATSLPVMISIAADAATGARSFTVRTPAGTAGSPTAVIFAVAALEPRIIEPRVIPQPIDVEPRLLTPQPVIAEPSPIAVRPIGVDPSPIAVSPIIAEPRAIIAEPRAIVAETRLVRPEVITPITDVIEARAVTPDLVTPSAPVIEARAIAADVGRVGTISRVLTPGKTATTTKKTTAAKKPAPTTRKKK